MVNVTLTSDEVVALMVELEEAMWDDKTPMRTLKRLNDVYVKLKAARKKRVGLATAEELGRGATPPGEVCSEEHP